MIFMTSLRYQQLSLNFKLMHFMTVWFISCFMYCAENEIPAKFNEIVAAPSKLADAVFRRRLVGRAILKGNRTRHVYFSNNARLTSQILSTVCLELEGCYLILLTQ